MTEEYITRLIDSQLELYLETFGAILIRGPKWCGKTTTAERYAKSKIKLQDRIKSKDYIAAADTDLNLILKGDNPHLIDEWQTVSHVWDAIRNDVDEKKSMGLYILTGSRVPAENSYMHSGAGRIGTLFMYPMSLFESGDSNGSISLLNIFSNSEDISGKTSDLSIDDLAYCICRGGWPANIGIDYKKCALRIGSYLDRIYESDDLSLKKYAKDVNSAKTIVRSYSRNISTPAKLKTIYDDVSKDDLSISESKFYDYITALKNTYIIEDVPAWNPAIRSKTSIRSTDKKNLIDPSIAALYLGITPENYMEDFNTFGFLFESLCIRDLRAYASNIGGTILYYRDKYGLEVDAVLKLDDGRYGLIEIKLGNSAIEDGAKHLCEIEKLIVESKLKTPSFKMILTGGKLAYVRNDGVYVVPIGCLRN